MSQSNGQGPTESHNSLGIAGGIAKTFIHSPLTPLLLIACLALGIMGLLSTPRQEDPQISVPMIDVFFQFPGASPQQVASLAADPLERMISEIPGIKHVYSASQRGGGMVTAQFEVGEDHNQSLVKLYDKLMSNMDKIPPGVSQPLVKPKSVDDVPMVALTLWSEELDDASLRSIALEVVQRLKQVKNTSQSFVVGGRSSQMRVEIDPARLRNFGISIDQLANTISSANERKKVGSAETSTNEITVYSGQFLRTASDVERLIVGIQGGRPIYVRDVATVTDGSSDATSVVQYASGPNAEEGEPKTAGAPAVTIAIAKKKGSNGVSVANDVLAQVETLKGRLIPDNVHVSVTRNYGKTANDKVNELISEMIGATSVVTLLIFLFLGLRPTIVVVVVIPIIILLTIFSAWILGFTVDRVSLFALIFSIGILVDDATVVVENIYRRWLEKGGIDTPTTVDAVREVGNPTILATLTIIAALLPMGFVSGMMGPYMRPIPVLGSVAMAFSLFAAFIFTPWLAIRIRPSLDKLRRMEKSEHRMSERLDGFYRGLLGPLLDSPAKARTFRLVIWGVMLAVCFMFYTTQVAVKMLPLDNKPEFNVVVNMPEGTALPVTTNIIQQLTEEVLKIPEVTAVQSYTGTASPFNFNGLVRHYYLRDKPWEGDIQVQLPDKDERERSSHQIAVDARERLTPLAAKLGARVQVVEMPPGPPVLQTMVAEVYGPDAETRRQVARELTKIFEKSEKVVDVDNLMQDEHFTWTFVVNQQKAERAGITNSDINRQLAMVMGGYTLGDAKLEHELEPRMLIIQAPLSVRSNMNSLGEIPIRTANNTLVPLSALGSFQKVPVEPIIYQKDLRPVEFVTGEVAGRLGAPIYGMIEISKLLENYKTPDGVELSGTLVAPPSDSFKSGFEWTGEWTVTYETFRDMGLAFMAALVLIYMLIVLEFQNFRLPGIIMAPIPLTLIGIIPGHWLFDAPFTATSMIGWIALAGIIVRNSILLVDFSMHAIAAGMPVREAVIQAVKTRTRPILITQLTMVAGSAAIIFDPIFQGMAISLLFGAIVSTALTLVVIPVACNRAAGAFSMAHGDPLEAQDTVPASPIPDNSPACMKQRPSLMTRMRNKVARRRTDDAPIAADAAATAAAGATYKPVPKHAMRGWMAPVGFAKESFGHLFSGGVIPREKPSLGNTSGAAGSLGSSALAKASGAARGVSESLGYLVGKKHGQRTPQTSGPATVTNTVETASAQPANVTMPAADTPSATPSTQVPTVTDTATQVNQPAPVATPALVTPTPVKTTPVASTVKNEDQATSTQDLASSASSVGAKSASEASRAIIAANVAGVSGNGAATSANLVTTAPKPKVKLKTTGTVGRSQAADAASNAVHLAQSGMRDAKETDAGHGAPASGNGQSDDLQQISGIGPVVSAQLKALGVKRIADIAGWTEDDVARVNEVLAVKGRIDREDWIGQAKALVAGRSNSANEG